MLKVCLTDPGSGQCLHSEEYDHEGEEGRMLLVTTIQQHYGRFKSASSTTATTTIITAPKPDGSLQLTDLVVSSAKSNNATVTIQFTDGAETVKICVFEITTQLNEAMSFAGLWQGWKDARLEMVTSSVAPATVAAGYIKHAPAHTLEFAAWDAQR